ncbi:MAG: hypothetical protein K5675_01490, partial [Lachnospiraceae bacterium]|nr:hypothetical protein [Lachnospiraceae bacterium]
KLNLKSIVMAAAVSLIGCLCAYTQNFALPKILYVGLFALFAVLFYCCLEYGYKKWQSIGALILVLVCLLSGALIRPIAQGFDAITTKPLYQEIQLLQQEEDTDNPNTYLAYNSTIMPSYLKACGVNVVNFVNTTPNVFLYSLIDLENQYKDIWNRYEHVKITISDNEETIFSLIQNDQIEINLAEKDVVLTECNYIVSQEELTLSNQWFALKKVYDEGGVYIYKVDYTQAAEEYASEQKDLLMNKIFGGTNDESEEK